MERERRTVSIAFIDYVGIITVLTLMSLSVGRIVDRLDRIATALEAKEPADAR